MQTKTLVFAAETPNSHIAIVECQHKEAMAHFVVANRQLSPVLAQISFSQEALHLTNGTAILFFAASSYERLRGWQFDRIEVTTSALSMMPERFLETRLKWGIVYRARGEYDG